MATGGIGGGRGCWGLWLLLLLSSPLLAAGADDYYGVWRGSVTEVARGDGQGSQYDVTIHIMPGEAAVSYPGLGCGGRLQPLSRRGRHWGFRDELDYGLDRCVGDGRTELTLLGSGLLAYRWYDTGGLRAEGYLRRRRQHMAGGRRRIDPHGDDDAQTAVLELDTVLRGDGRLGRAEGGGPGIRLL